MSKTKMLFLGGLKYLMVAIVLLFSGQISVATAQESQPANLPFNNDVELTYRVLDSGTTHIIQDYTLTNTSPTTYVSQYSFKTTLDDIENVRVISNDQIITPNVTKDGEGSTISFVFPDQVVGQGKQRNFVISYDSNALATIAGKILEVRIPNTLNPENYSSINTKVIIPERFESPNRINVQPTRTERDGNTITMYFDGQSEQVNAIFGDTQFFNASLRYNLENTTATTVLNQIALPPDTPLQRTFYHSIDPKPMYIEADTDGNWIATYELKPHTRQTIFANATIRVTLETDETIPVVEPVQEHTLPQLHWESDDPAILNYSGRYTTPRSINDFVVSHLSYNYERTAGPIDRLGAVRVLETPNRAICQEFTDLFIALARANNIPARRVTGHAYAENRELRPLSLEGDVLHAWPEFYDTNLKQWHPIDPTWQYTTNGTDYFSHFDVNHIVFSINGVDSQIPFPAGAYKTVTEQNSQDVVVTVTDKFPETSPILTSNIQQKKFFGIPIPGFYTISVTNQTGSAWYDLSHTVTSSHKYTRFDTKIEQIRSYLPYQTITSNIIIRNPVKLGTNVTIDIKQSNDSVYTAREDTSSLPLPFPIKTDTRSLLIMAGVSVLFILGLGSLLVLRRKQASTVRRQS